LFLEVDLQEVYFLFLFRHYLLHHLHQNLLVDLDLIVAALFLILLLLML
tara:strand:- start:474 stop:620 length:147 start_codon:yes stop_codon:yes gene_type:complete